MLVVQLDVDQKQATILQDDARLGDIKSAGLSVEEKLFPAPLRFKT
jgi:hypothetical protein